MQFLYIFVTGVFRLGSWSSCFILRLTSPAFYFLAQLPTIHIYIYIYIYIDIYYFVIILSYDHGCQRAFSAQEKGNQTHHAPYFNNN